MKRILMMTLVLWTLQPVWAVQHIVPGAYPHAVQDMIHRPSAAQMRAAGGNLRAALTSGSTGPKNVAVIVVQFPAGNATLISGSRSILSLSNVNAYFSSLAQYYSEVSYTKLALTFTFFGPTAAAGGDASAISAGAYTLGHPMEYYGCGDEGVGCSGVTTPAQGANGNYLVRDAIDAARTGGHPILISKDHVPAGTFDAIIVVHAGNGNETTQGTNGDIWSIFYSQDSDVIGGINPVDSTAAAAGFNEGDVDPETETNGISSPFGVMCHEFGHSLGLPDFYNTSALGGSSVVGKWEIMDMGPYVGSAGHLGENPSHMCAWDKISLGWITPTVGSSRQSVTLNAVELTANALKIPVQTGLPQEYFLVEYRLTTSGAAYDRNIPGSGLLVWHIDDAIMSARGINAVSPNVPNTVNTGIPHYGASIVPADGSAPGFGGGTAGNPFGNGENFTSPNSDAFGGVPSGISMVTIAGVGSATVTSKVTNIAATAGQTIVKLINYPNPAGKGYAHANGAGHTTIQAQLSRPANDFTILIYTLSGDLVRKIGLSDVSLSLDRSADNKWVYEYVWDLTNGDGAMVAPGVYLYLLRADGSTQSNKAVVIR